jgi:hypothetical protein
MKPRKPIMRLLPLKPLEREPPDNSLPEPGLVFNGKGWKVNPKLKKIRYDTIHN